MNGNIQITFRREPDFFIDELLGNNDAQTILNRDPDTGEMTGFGTRAIKSVYINGKIQNVGYLNGLRVRPAYRGGRSLINGYRLLKELHQDGKVEFYLTTIGEENVDAIKLLAGGRKGLPTYYPWGRYRTYAIDLRRKHRRDRINEIRIERGSSDNIDGIVDCLRRNGRKKQFYPVYNQIDFSDKPARILGLEAEDFYLAWNGNRIVGVAARWDQRKFKQTIVSGYEGAMRFVKPFYNAGARLLGYSPLPAPGKEIQFFYIACVAADDNDPEIFGSLLRHIYNEADRKVYSHFLVGLHAEDPLSEAIKGYHHVGYNTLIYLVLWEDHARILESLRGRTPYLELGTL